MSILAEQQQNCHKRVSFSMIPLEDLEWAIEQKPAAMQMFLECWRSDPYGSRWMQLNTKLKPSAFREAKKQLANQDLFVFKREVSIQDSRSTVCWLTRNLHGSRVKDFWKAVTPTELDATDAAINATDTAIDTAHTELVATDTAAILPQTQLGQGIQSASTSFQHLNSTSSSISAELESREEEFKLEEKEEEIQVSNGEELLKWVTSTKIPALNLKDPPRNPEVYARAMIARDGNALKKEFVEVMGERDFKEKAAELRAQVMRRTGEWEASGVKVLVYDDLNRMPMVILDGTAIAAVDFLAKPIEPNREPLAPLSNPSNIQNRKARQSRLRSADQAAEFPGVEFLTECWGDVLLRSQVKALVAKYPQWGISLKLLGNTQ